MKSNLLITSVLVLFCLCAYQSMAQHSTGDVTLCTAGPEAAKCTGSADCKACKNCTACAHCKNGGKCSVCKKSLRTAGSKDNNDERSSPHDGNDTQVEWSSKSLKPAATTLQRLDVRSGPGSAYKVVGAVSAEDPLIIIGEREGWYKIVVRHADLVGFVEVAYVSIVK